MATPVLPRPQSPIAGREFPAATWYDFFRDLLQFVQANEGNTAEIHSILDRLEELEESQPGTFVIQGLASVQVDGLPQNGIVQVYLLNDTDAPGNTYYYGTGPDGTKGWNSVRSALDFGDGIDLTTGSDGVTEISFNAATAEVAHDPDSTIKSVQQTINYLLTPGIVSGCVLERVDVDTVRITAGRILFASADDDGDSDLIFHNVPEATFDIPADQQTRYFAWTYNGGAPLAVMELADAFNRDTEIPVGLATRFNGTMVVTPNRYRVSQPLTNSLQRYDALAPLLRDSDVGGLVLGASAGQVTTVTGGRIWARLEDFAIPSQASNTDAMVSVYFDGVDLAFTSGLTQWDNANYNDLGSGTLVPLGLNKWAVLWFFIAVDGTYGFAYGTAEHNTQGAAANESLPPYLNQDFQRQGLLLGRYVFQQGEDIPTLIEQTVSALTNISVINDHNSLANLQGGTVGEYYHLTAAQYAAVSNTATLTPSQITANTDDYAPTGHLTARRFRLSTDASHNLTGLQGGTDGRDIVIANVGSFDLVLVHDATSTAASRFLLPNGSNLTLNPNDSASLWYDGTSSRWRAIGT